MRKRPMHNQILDNNDIRPVILDMLDIVAGRDEIPPNPEEQPLSLFDEDGNWNLEKILAMNPKYASKI